VGLPLLEAASLLFSEATEWFTDKQSASESVFF